MRALYNKGHFLGISTTTTPLVSGVGQSGVSEVIVPVTPSPVNGVSVQIIAREGDEVAEAVE